MFKFSKLSFEVACLLKANPSSLEFIPSPLSDTIISVLPPSLIKILISSALASMLFSTSSLTADDGLSKTSPAAILLTISSDKILIFINF